MKSLMTTWQWQKHGQRKKKMALISCKSQLPWSTVKRSKARWALNVTKNLKQSMKFCRSNLDWKPAGACCWRMWLVTSSLITTPVFCLHSCRGKNCRNMAARVYNIEVLLPQIWRNQSQCIRKQFTSAYRNIGYYKELSWILIFEFYAWSEVRASLLSLGQ